jgi:hypothetical protein
MVPAVKIEPAVGLGSTYGIGPCPTELEDSNSAVSTREHALRRHEEPRCIGVTNTSHPIVLAMAHER